MGDTNYTPLHSSLLFLAIGRSLECLSAIAIAIYTKASFNIPFIL
ncbi:hypothetical protein [Lyngbya sp. CCAP 1446/10]|nr:hypothetical protein [Lyngbya sp. CCAP 1446/10]